jgi:hypothetical protein
MISSVGDKNPKSLIVGQLEKDYNLTVTSFKTSLHNFSHCINSYHTIGKIYYDPVIQVLYITA